MSEIVNASPTKRFFIDMLTRDIELEDAILDLLDNCIDGAIRVGSEDEDQPYLGFEATMLITPDSFVLEDNCGGIPKQTAIDYAFRMGRPQQEVKETSQTIGVYGIGMKRAIFKIGREAEVLSRNSEDCYTVTIDNNWTQDEKKWDLPLTDVGGSCDISSTKGGTRIKIECLNPSVQMRWKNQLETFVSGLQKKVSDSFSVIIEKGFKIVINSEEVVPNPIQFLFEESDNKEAIRPYYAEKTYDDVKMTLVVGLYGSPPSMEELDEAAETKRATEDAGITVICNDRVVLYNDKSHLTGWGEAGVPKYHTQFVGIKGILTFDSSNPEKLPMTTTKRGVDLSSPLYADAKEYTRDAIRLFTSYTNKWKGRNQEEREHSESAVSKRYKDISSSVNHGIIATKTSRSAKVFKPNLPKPRDARPYRVIHFTRSIEDISYLDFKIFSDTSISHKPSEVGEKCFDLVFNYYKSEEDNE